MEENIRKSINSEVELGQNGAILNDFKQKKTEIIVVGGGPSGVVAAVAAARNGVDTLLVERYGFLGGMAITGIPLHTFHDSHGRQVIRGIPQEMIDRLAKIKGIGSHIDARTLSRKHRAITATPVDPESMKRVCMELIEESGVRLLLHSLAVDTIVKNDMVKAVVTEGKSGRLITTGDIIIDATGDGDIAASAGAAYEKGREENGLMQSGSLIFRLGGININNIPNCEDLSNLVQRGYEDGEIPVRELFLLVLPKGDVSINATKVTEFDGTSVEDLTRAEIITRKQIIQIVDFLRNRVPGCNNTYLLETAPMIGVRETRRIIGEYVLTKEDILEEREFEDAIARGSYPIDIHDPKGLDVSFTYPRTGGSYQIPYRCLVPKRIDNLLVAGRCISTSHEAHASTRVMVPCMATGQAAGTAASLGIKTGASPRQVDVSHLQTLLREQGVIL
jgi:hypothetical protein